MKSISRPKFYWLLVACLLSLAAQAQTLQLPEQVGAAKHGVYVIAHRGVHRGIPENSLPAYAKAIELGCDFIEVDIRRTRDGKFVSIHNPTIDAYAEGESGKVSDMTLQQIKALDIGSAVGPQWRDTRVPTLEEILELAKGKVGIYLDLKVPAVAELLQIIKQYDMEHSVVWYIPMNFYLETGRDDFGQSLPMPDPHSYENLGDLLDNHSVPLVATDMGVLSKDFVTRAHARNTMVFVDEDDGSEVEWAQILRWNTDGIQTDHPEKLIEFLKRQKQ
ncbi:glycerophosphodiester phosphodiesterase [Microbulbifer hainanensis]|uniref:glycerophosphodiester phosphodiesterase n=1 Tax=Microbulbifer hainanensis TaxID=2735675 RepID=UPI0018683986|nr:glycerophosphodiester phosphodiesterase family protein [Microbulbifer hainanensis]